MKKTLSICSILISFAATAQSIEINANGGTANASAILDLKSTTKGFLLPRMTNAQMRAIPNPAQGLLAFCTDCGINGDYYFYKGTAWVALGSTTVSVSTTVGSVSDNADEKGATITNGVLNLAPANATNPGIVTKTAQTIAGVKTFSNGIVGNVTGNVTGNAATVTTNANLTGVVTSNGNVTSIANRAITNAMLANGAVANLSGINTGDQTLPTLSSLGAVASNSAITGATNTKITYDAKGLVTAGTAATTADIAASTNKNYVTDAQQNVINNTSGTNTGDQILPTLSSLGAVASNATITGATNTKITYDSKGLVTEGTAATTADIAESTDKKYVTNDQQTVIRNTSGTNTGDNAVNSLYSGLVTNATHTGDVIGSITLTIANDAVTTAKIAADAITDSKVKDVAVSKITGTLPVSKGGTGSDTKTFVDLTTNQTIAGTKTFIADLIVNELTVGKGAGGKSNNTAIGVSTLSSNTTGSENTAMGAYALNFNTTGSSNTAFGRDAGAGIVNGSNNVFLGSFSGSSSDMSNAIAIGSGAIVTQSNAIQLGNSSIANVKTSGTISVNGLAINGNPKPSAVVDLSNSVKGFLPPKLNNYQRNSISSPEIGLIIFNTDSNCLEFYLAEGWYNMCKNQIMVVPKVSTNNLENIFDTSVRAGLEISEDGGSPITEYGICISSTNSIPTISDRKIIFGYSAKIPLVEMNQITDLANSTKYYLRGYAINSIGISYGIVMEFTTKVLMSGLIAYYPFNGNANDESGNGNNGTTFNVVNATNRFGTPNSSFYFSSVNCYPHIEATVNTSLITTALTISIWVKKVGNGCYAPRILEFTSLSPRDGPGSLALGFGYNNTWGLDHANSIGTSTTSFKIYPTGPNVWTHLVYTNDGTTCKFYQNGQLIDSSPTVAGSPILARLLTIGRMNQPAYDAFNGNLDDMGVWNRALSIDEIKFLYESDFKP
jgi:hypothetical protein